MTNSVTRRGSIGDFQTDTWSKECLPAQTYTEILGVTFAVLPKLKSPALRQSWPIVFTMLVNKIGNIGLELVPMLLVDRQILGAEAVLLISAMKSSQIAGIFAGGWLSDRIGHKRSIIISFVISAIALLALPFCHSSLQIGFAASVAQAGSAIFSAPLRGVLMRSVDRPFQQEAMGWMRTANNLGGIFSYSIAGLSGHFGLLPLFLIDASTSLAAAAITHFFLGNTPSNTSVKNDQHTIHSRTNPALLDWTLYLSAATLIAGFGFLMQMFITGAATKFRLEHAESGVAIFSRIMLINTVMCTALNVFASRLFKRPAIAMPLGIALMGLGGTLVFLNGSGTPEKYLFGAFLLTLGELSFAAVSQLLVMRLVPKVKNQASVFSVGVFIQTGGSMLGASSALLFIQSHNAGWCFAAAAMAILIAQLGITRLIERLKPDCI